MELEMIASEIQTAIGIETKQLFRIGLLKPREAKKWLVKHYYYQWAKSGRTYADIKYELSLRYNISVSSIEKIIYRDNKI
jgi:hypothetical protein